MVDRVISVPTTQEIEHVRILKNPLCVPLVASPQALFFNALAYAAGYEIVTDPADMAADLRAVAYLAPIH
jgi:hypothetical protein